jgi:transposase
MNARNKVIRSIKHYYKQSSNKEKVVKIENLLNECFVFINDCISYIWDEVFYDKYNYIVFDISSNKFETPKYIDYNKVKTSAKISARMKSSISNQACGVIRACFEHKLKTINKINYYKSKNLSTTKLEKELQKIKISKPTLNKDTFAIEISSKNIDFKSINSKKFNEFLRLKSLGDNFSHIKIPIKYNKRDYKWINLKAKKLNSVLLSKSSVQIRYELEDASNKIMYNKNLKDKNIIGIDTGYNAVITASKGNIKTVNNHNQTFDSICKKLNRKKKGSKSYQRTQKHRTNFINWSVRQIDLKDINQINLEKINNIFYKKNTSMNLKRWVHAEIERKIIEHAEEYGVHVNLQSSAYYSQRCSNCGYVHSNNRKSKKFKCKKCKFEKDADLNAALNHEQELFDIPYFVKSSKLNRADGFFWKPDGIFDLDGRELRNPHQHEKH